MRGKEHRLANSMRFYGITPAYAGKSYRYSFRKICNKDHPRLCGEKFAFGTGRSGVTWITPAYAGKRQKQACESFNDMDHPRLCGEKATRTLGQALRAGSPPPMRGKVDTEYRDKRLERITPAYAGKSSAVPYPVPASRDHPRLCGEKREYFLGMKSEKGSPPPMRGKAAHYTGGSIECRITPAYAGKRYSVSAF